MPTPHNHTKWLAKKLAKSTAWKDKKKEAKAEVKRKTTKSIPTSSTHTRNLLLSKSLKSALTTHVHLSDAEAEHIIFRVMAKIKDYSKDASLKYYVCKTWVVDPWKG